MADCKSPWGKLLSDLPALEHSDVDAIVKRSTSTYKSSKQKGYKFFWDSYVHDIEVRSCEGGHEIRCKCYRSQKKSEKPHTLKMTILDQGDTAISNHLCSCTAGKGFCSHKVAVLYQLSHYQSLNLQRIPEIVSSTSKPQKWHVPPRTHGIAPRPLTSVSVIKPNLPVELDQQKRRRVTDGITSPLFNPVTVPLNTIRLPEKLLPTLKAADSPVQWLQIWSDDEEEATELVDSRFGPVVKGCLLSYQEKALPEKHFLGPKVAPPFDLPLLHCPFEKNLDEAAKTLFNSLKLTTEQCVQIEKDTRSQAKCPEWHKLRHNRLTASKFKVITGRRGKFVELAKDFLTKKNIVTAAMTYGIEHEDEAVDKYQRNKSVDVHPVGFVINPSSPHLGCSPDRRVYDVEEVEKWGLLEVKCSLKEKLADLNYLIEKDDGFSLKKSHAYYEQCMGQMGISGGAWCDFFAMCQDEFHCERIYFDGEFFEAMKCKLDNFYYDYFLAELVAMNVQS